LRIIATEHFTDGYPSYYPANSQNTKGQISNTTTTTTDTIFNFNGLITSQNVYKVAK